MKKFAVSIIFVFFVLGIVFYFAPSLFFDEALRADISLKPDDQDLVDLGKLVYKNNCASCHGVNLEGQEQWRQPDADGYMPAPPHDESGHTWHHPDDYLFLMTKYGGAHFQGKSHGSKKRKKFNCVFFKFFTSILYFFAQLSGVFIKFKKKQF